MTPPDDLWAGMDALPAALDNPFVEGDPHHAEWQRQADAEAREKLDAELRGIQAAAEANGWRARFRLTPASAFKIKPVRWVWEGRMPAGEIVLVGGREGVGKSTWLAWLASAITNGNLPGMYHGQPRAILYAASEDAWSYTIAPRMLAAGADLDLVYRIDVVDEDGQPGGLILPRDCQHLPDIAAEVNAAMLMCDPIMSLIDERINSFKAQELRKALEPLSRAAQAAGLAVPALVHFNKNQTADLMSMISGSRAWAEVARAVIGIAQDKEADQYSCVVSQVKNNLGRSDLPHLTYTIDGCELETEEGEPARVGRLRWTGETDRSAEEILRGQGHAPDEALSSRKVGDNTQKIIAFVLSYNSRYGRPAPTNSIEGKFGQQIKPATVRKILARCVKGQDLIMVSRGMYRHPAVTMVDPEFVTHRGSEPACTSASVTNSDLDPGPECPNPDPALLTPLSHVTSVTTAGQGANICDSGVTSKGEVSQTESDEATTCDIVTLVTGVPPRARTRAREAELTSCRVCYGPLDDTDGTGRHATCQPPDSSDP